MKRRALTFIASLAAGLGAAVALTLATPASADPSLTCPDGSVPGTDYSQCQPWRNLPMDPNTSGQPGTWGPNNMGPSWYTPCYNDYNGGC